MEQEKPGFTIPDPAEFVRNMVKVAERSQRLMQKFVNRQINRQAEPPKLGDPSRVRAIAPAFLDLTKHMLANSNYILEAQSKIWPAYLQLLQGTFRRLLGEEAPPTVTPDRNDKRFRAPEWTESIAFDFIKQSYLLTSNWLMQTVTGVDGMEQANARKVAFYTKQFVDAISPSNFVLTNPEILRATLTSNGENLLHGLEHLLEDLERGEGKLSIRMTDMEAFEVGRNIAITPGKVIFRNPLIELIQYTPTTETVYQRPLLIFPPWINKFYILDLTEEKSFIKWAVAQGYTVFVVSWANPDAELANKTFESYLLEGVYPALDAVELATGESEVNAIGYCIGGTLLTAALAHMAARKDTRIKCATFFAAQADFSEAGELKVFIDEEQINALGEKMDQAGGLLESSEMSNTFNMLRSNDLIWSFVVNNYLMGRQPAPFDLLYWNSDQTNMPKEMHLFYLRECYLKNNLAKGEMVLAGEKLDLGKITIPVFLQSSLDDHIAPYRSVYKSTKLLSGPVQFLIAGSGHIAGVINPPSANKYNYWKNESLPDDVEEWRKGATEYPGSWWPNWHIWHAAQSGAKVPARIPGSGKLPVLEDAPGSYVRVKGR
ncbi:MAG TPA: class I poly(R)-hydroxyalkanoic acid synthase [Alphaproteobacteria bacterium]|nr:class I poly(R)-hydroxyalkanoic acid synthase [Alphaproteobacteria bacterium]